VQESHRKVLKFLASLPNGEFERGTMCLFVLHMQNVRGSVTPYYILKCQSL